MRQPATAAYRLDSLPSPPSSRDLTGRLVGRLAERDQLAAALRAAASGQGGTVVVAGEAGIGKTRLVTDLAATARDLGAYVLTGRCVDVIGPALPYLAFVDALHGVTWPNPAAVCGAGTGAARPSGTHNDLAALSRLRTSLAGARAGHSSGENTGDPTGAGGDPAGAGGQLLLFEDVRHLVENLSAVNPLLLVLEDLHWADVSTLDLLVYLSHAVVAHRALIVVTYRTDETRDGAHRVLTRLGRDPATRWIDLEPLSLAELADVLDEQAGDAVPANLVQMIFNRSGGNPFFAAELLSAAVRPERGLPTVVREALRHRLSRLDERAGMLARVIAAAGRQVSHQLLAAVTAMPERHLNSALRQSIDEHVLVGERTGVRFRHALLAEEAYAGLIPGEREDLHARLAEALRADPSLAAHGARGEIAAHWAAAGRRPQAFVASLEAADEAEAGYGLAEALSHLERALRLWPDVTDAAELAGVQLPAVLARAAELADLTGAGPRAAELVRRAIDLVEAGGDRVRAGLLYERLGSYLIPTGDRRAGLAACRQAVRRVPARPASPQRARVLTTLANALMLSWRHADSQLVCAEALAAAQASGDERPALRARGVLGVDLCYLGRPEDGLAELHRARALAREVGTPRDVGHSEALLCEILIATGRMGEAARAGLDGVTTARRLGVERSFGSLLAAYAAEALLETGEWDRADELLDWSLRPGGAFWTHYPHLLRAQLALGRGELATARRHLDAASQAAREPVSAARYARLAGELWLWDGRPDLAATAIADGLAVLSVGEAAFQRTRLGALGLRAEADWLQLAPTRRDPAAVESARRRARRLVSSARRCAPAGTSVTPDTAAWLAMAQAEFSRIDGRDGAPRWQEAARAWDGIGRPYHHAYCLWRFAEALLSSSPPLAGSAGASPAAEPGELSAAAVARQAHQIATRLGARPLVREVELLALRARLDLSEPRPVAPADRCAPALNALGLTSREAQVLTLLAAGYTNRQIATEFTISVKTASVHVSNILRKLGVATRVQAAAIAHRTLSTPTS